MGPLHGFKVIDMTSVLMGPVATLALGDMGADVIKIEAPGGDLVRQIGPAHHADMGPIYLHANRNKRSVCLDLKQGAALDVLKRLLADADVLAYNVRPQAMARLGLGFDVVQHINPRIIYAGLFGFAQEGPYAARPAYDDLIQGGSGLASLMAQATDGTPRYVPSALADRVVGITAVNGILAALLARVRTGRGQRVDVPMFETMAHFVLSDHLGGLTFEPRLDEGGYARHLSPHRRPYQTLDGFVCALVYNDKQWATFLPAVGRAELLADARFAQFAQRARHINLVYGELAKIFAQRSTAAWLVLLQEADIPHMAMNDLQGVLNDPHLAATGFFSVTEHPSEGPVRSMRLATRFSDTSPDAARPAPRLGEHSREVLLSAGYGMAEIDALQAQGALVCASELTRGC